MIVAVRLLISTVIYLVPAATPGKYQVNDCSSTSSHLNIEWSKDNMIYINFVKT